MKPKWNDLTMKERSDLMSLFLKHGIGSLSDMKRIYDGEQDMYAPLYAMKVENGELVDEIAPADAPFIDLRGLNRKGIREKARNLASYYIGRKAPEFNFVSDLPYVAMARISDEARLFNKRFLRYKKKGEIQESKRRRRSELIDRMKAGDSQALGTLIGEERSDWGSSYVAPFMLGAPFGPAGMIGGLTGMASDAAVNTITGGERESFGDLIIDRYNHPIGSAIMEVFNPVNYVAVPGGALDDFTGGLSDTWYKYNKTKDYPRIINNLDYNKPVIEGEADPKTGTFNVNLSSKSPEYFASHNNPTTTVAEEGSVKGAAVPVSFTDNGAAVTGSRKTLVGGIDRTVTKVYDSLEKVDPRTVTPKSNELNSISRGIRRLSSEGVEVPGEAVITEHSQLGNPNILSTNSPEVTQAVKKAAERLQNVAEEDGILMGSTRMIADDIIGGVPGDSEFITTASRLGGLKNRLKFKKDRDLMSVKGEKGTSQYAHGTGDVDIDVIEVNDRGQAVGKLAHEIVRIVDPEGYEAYTRRMVRKYFNSNQKITDLPITDSNGKVYTDEDVYQMLRNSELGKRDKGIIDAMGSTKDKHVARNLSMILDPNMSADTYIEALSRRMKGYIGGWKTLTESYPSIRFDDIESNRRFLSAIGVSEEYADNIDVVRKLAEQYYTDFLTTGRFVNNLGYDTFEGLLDAGFTNFSLRGGTAAGGGGNNVTIPMFRYGNHGGYGENLVIQQHGLPKSVKISTPEDLAASLNDLRTKTNQKAADLLEKLGRENSPEAAEEVAQSLDMPFIINDKAFDGYYLGKLYKGEPEAWGVGMESDYPEIGGLFHSPDDLIKDSDIASTTQSKKVRYKLDTPKERLPKELQYEADRLGKLNSILSKETLTEEDVFRAMTLISRVLNKGNELFTNSDTLRKLEDAVQPIYRYYRNNVTLDFKQIETLKYVITSLSNMLRESATKGVENSQKDKKNLEN